MLHNNRNIFLSCSNKVSFSVKADFNVTGLVSARWPSVYRHRDTNIYRKVLFIQKVFPSLKVDYLSSDQQNHQQDVSVPTGGKLSTRSQRYGAGWFSWTWTTGPTTGIMRLQIHSSAQRHFSRDLCVVCSNGSNVCRPVWRYLSLS